MAVAAPLTLCGHTCCDKAVHGVEGVAVAPGPCTVPGALAHGHLALHDAIAGAADTIVVCRDSTATQQHSRIAAQLKNLQLLLAPAP
jgi:hypothetical protein